MEFEKITAKISDSKFKYYKLILLLSHVAQTNSKLLTDASKSLNYPYINLSLVMAGKLVDIPAQKRCSQVVNLLPDIVKSYSKDVLFFDHIELLFLPELGIDCLRALQQMSRNKTIIVGWTGHYDGKKLTYASQEHPEYRRYDGLTDEDFTFVNV